MALVVDDRSRLRERAAEINALEGDAVRFAACFRPAFGGGGKVVTGGDATVNRVKRAD